MLSDALGEIARGQEVVEFACGISHLLKGGHSESVSTGVDVHSKRDPLGVVGIISPFNFPAMVPMWFFPIAIAAGNTVVLKPSEKDPSAALWIARLWKEAGLPDGVFNVLQGDKEAVDALLQSPVVQAISFVGSTPIAQYVYEQASLHGKRVQALGGAKNHMVVLPDADLDLAADSAVNAGFGSAGERCMAISVLVAVGPIGDELVARIADRTRNIVIGDGSAAATSGAERRPTWARSSRRSTATRSSGLHRLRPARRRQGRRRRPRGRPARGAEDGFWLGPTLFDNVPPDMEIYREEIFGPVLSVVRVDTYDEAVELVNGNPYGNGTAVFTNDGGAARRFEADVHVGMIGVNVPVPVPVAYYSFGGWKRSLLGDTHAHGAEGVHFFTRGKVVTTRWIDPAQPPAGRPRAGIPAECLNSIELVELTPDRVHELDRKHVFHSWSAQGSLNPMVITKAEGSYVWDQDGQRLLDFTSQLVFTNLGHQHPRIVSAIQEQAAYLCTVAPQHANAARSEAARLIASHTPGRPRQGVLHQRGSRRQRARDPDGAAAHRADQGALDVPLVPRRHPPRRQRHRRPAPLGQRPRRGRHGALLRAVPLPQRLPRDHRGRGVRARAAAPGRHDRARGPADDRRDHARGHPRHGRHHDPAARATSPAYAACATSTASC